MVRTTGKNDNRNKEKKLWPPLPQPRHPNRAPQIQTLPSPLLWTQPRFRYGCCYPENNGGGGEVLTFPGRSPVLLVQLWTQAPHPEARTPGLRPSLAHRGFAGDFGEAFDDAMASP